MEKKKFFYLLKIQYLGFRFSGWQKQTNAKTVQEMVDRTISFIVKHDNHKTLGAGRTDAKVSTNEYALELYISRELNLDTFLDEFNENLPADIRALEVIQVDESFNIMEAPELKEYLYIFTSGKKPHPFCAPFMVYFQEAMDIDLMKEGAKIFEGRHNFKAFCYKPKENATFERAVDFCEIVENNLYTANFFPKESWILHVHGKGFMRHQVRIMMGALIKLGRGDITLNDIKKSLETGELCGQGFIAPSSGLMLNKLHI